MTLSGELAVSIVISLPTILFTLATVSQNSKNRQPSTTMSIIDYAQNWPTKIKEQLASDLLKDKTVMITGASDGIERSSLNA